MRRSCIYMPVLCLVLLLPYTAIAGSFSVAPIRITLAARRPYSLLRITNNAEQPLTVQARAYRWTSNGQDDVLTATSEVILSPPIMTIAPKATQTVRVGLRFPNENGEETSYRILLDEVPAVANSPAQAGFTLRTLLRISLPVYAQPRQPVKANLHWSAGLDDTGKIRLRVVNSGAAHVSLNQLQLSSGDNRENSRKLDGSVCLLPRQRHEWTVDDPVLARATQFNLEATTDSGNVRETVSRLDN